MLTLFHWACLTVTGWLPWSKALTHADVFIPETVIGAGFILRLALTAITPSPTTDASTAAAILINDTAIQTTFGGCGTSTATCDRVYYEPIGALLRLTLIT